MICGLLGENMDFVFACNDLGIVKLYIKNFFRIINGIYSFMNSSFFKLFAFVKLIWNIIYNVVFFYYFLVFNDNLYARHRRYNIHTLLSFISLHLDNKVHTRHIGYSSRWQRLNEPLSLHEQSCCDHDLPAHS